jgi:hypothetical protein
MKKNILLIACLVILFTHPMERIDHFSVKLYGTIINVSKQSLRNVAGTVGCVIVGKHQQQLLDHILDEKQKCIRNSPPFNKFYHPGLIHLQDAIFYKNENDESNSDDDTYKPFEEENKFTLTQVVPQQKGQKIVGVTEPYITLDGWYQDHLTNQLVPCFRYRKTKSRKELTLYKEEAIAEASKDLRWCYENALMTGIIHTSVAISTLSADIGFPREKAVPIALTEIINFIRNYAPRIYDRVELVVKKRSEFAAYKKILIDYWQKPCLLILAHKDENHFLHNVPREILDSILQLMHRTTY